MTSIQPQSAANLPQGHGLQPTLADILGNAADDHGDPASTANKFSRLIAAGFGTIALPAGGATLARWSMLAQVAAHDLSLVKLYEAHVDALAILAELGTSMPLDDTRWGVWCAETPGVRVEVITPAAAGAEVLLRGVKDWCSGAAAVSHGLVSAWDADGRPWLVAVAMAQASITIDAGGWCAVGMAGTGTRQVRFEDATATCIGPSGAYLNRPGFWHGGAGIAACWFGAAAEIGRFVREQLCAQAKPDPHRLAHLGAIDLALCATQALLRDCALRIDAHPAADAGMLALRARLQVEACANIVMHHAGEALGAAPFCRDRHFARLMADLPVFLRQSHAQRDRAALGLLVKQAPTTEAGSTAATRDDHGAAPQPGWFL